MELTKLTPIEWLLLPILFLFLRGEARLRLNERIIFSHEMTERKKARREEAKLLAKEAKLFETLIIETWTRLGEFYAARYRYDTGTSKGSKGIFKNRSHHVKFERIFT